MKQLRVRTSPNSLYQENPASASELSQLYILVPEFTTTHEEHQILKSFSIVAILSKKLEKEGHVGSGGFTMNDMTPTPKPVNILRAYKNESFCNKVNVARLIQSTCFHTTLTKTRFAY